MNPETKNKAISGFRMKNSIYILALKNPEQVFKREDRTISKHHNDQH